QMHMVLFQVLSTSTETRKMSPAERYSAGIFLGFTTGMFFALILLATYERYRRRRCRWTLRSLEAEGRAINVEVDVDEESIAVSSMTTVNYAIALTVEDFCTKYPEILGPRAITRRLISALFSNDDF